MRAGRAVRRLTADRLAADHRRRRSRTRLCLRTASHFGRTIMFACTARESARQYLTGEGENDEKCDQPIKHNLIENTHLGLLCQEFFVVFLA